MYYDFRRVDDGTGPYTVCRFDTLPIMQSFLLLHSSFNRISHTYLLLMLKCYGYGMKFITLIQRMWYKTYFSVQINGYIVRTFTI
jgi:hypothetical protein